MRELIELESCIRALLLWKNEYGGIRDTDGSRAQIKVLEKALADYDLMDQKMRESERLGG